MTKRPNPQATLEELLRRQSARAVSFAALRGGAECPTDFELAALAEGELAEARAAAVREHLADCGHCVLLVQAALQEVAQSAAEAPGLERLAPIRSPWRRKRTWLAIAAAALLLVFFSPLLDEGELATDPTLLARIEALPVARPRGAATDEAETAFRAGLERYAAADYAGAQERLGAARQLAPERADVALYLGSCALLLGRGDEAVPQLRAAAAGAEGGRREEARWQLVQALLTLARADQARAILDELAAGGGNRAAAAREVLRDLR